MSRLSLSKSSLARQNRQLQTFERYLPSLDLKRRQLIAERAKARAARAALETRRAELRAGVGERLPMLANTEIDVADLVRIEAVRVGEENLLGTRLPVLDRVELGETPYSLFGKPHWVDQLVVALRRMLELEIAMRIGDQRVALIEDAVRKVTQRVNLFEKVLIPRAKANIRRIRIYLSDTERAAIVRAKIAKGKRLREALA